MTMLPEWGAWVECTNRKYQNPKKTVFRQGAVFSNRAVFRRNPELIDLTAKVWSNGSVNHSLMGTNILIVEDDTVIAKMYAEKFEREGFVVKRAENGIEAATVIASFIPDVILMDMMMPTMNGFETIGMIRTLAPSLEQSKIIVFSNLSSEQDRERAMSLGADGYLLKAETTPSDAVTYVRKVME